ncbi:hypothetical protein BDV95DRAFT_612242 [Massariosphaeria phaeospora]|uniref:F-box domain-containing protein n=1 Tax=Massariosphaeria phaeospora TaxID=100035 RepID=A0A7C8HZA4_9PLEO|nr:hypothetical protein BDV95DRAFT_612242 [Massariosphaeria phaeospora]
MSLFVLPAELVREILHTLDPQSFYMCLQTSSVFREHALSSKKLLLEQISRLPGSPGGVDGANHIKILLQRFGLRAAQHLQTGVEWMADMHVWRPVKMVDMKRSCIVNRDGPTPSRHSCDYANPLLFVEVVADATVNVYNLEPDHGGYQPQLKHVISPRSLPDHFSTEEDYEVLGIASDMSLIGGPTLLAVLYKERRLPTRQLIMFRLDNDFGPVVVETFVMDRPDEVVDIVVTGLLPILLFRRIVENYGVSYHCVSYKNESDEMAPEKRKIIEEEAIPTAMLEPNERIASLSIHEDNSIHLYPSTLPFPMATFDSVPGPGIPPERRRTSLPLLDVFSSVPIGRPLSLFHRHQVQSDDFNDGEPTCIDTVLRLMIARGDPSNLDPVPSRTGAFLLKSIHYHALCEPFDLNTVYPPSSHIFVAELVNLPGDLHNLSTLGLKVAVSASAHRIAIASWKTVKVWSLDPDAFLDQDYSLRGGEGVPGDYSYIHGCGWQFYASAHKETFIENGCVLLQPVELPSAGVVYGLEFRNESELWGWCEQGLCRWRFGVTATGKRGTEGLGGSLKAAEGARTSPLRGRGLLGKRKAE